MKYEIVNGELVISGSLADYGTYVNGTCSQLFPFCIKQHSLRKRLERDAEIRREFERTGKLPQDLSTVTAA
jgi:hypothetical protein